MKEIIVARGEVREALIIGRSTFDIRIHDGMLKGFKEGNRYKVPLSSVEAYVATRMEVIQFTSDNFNLILP